MMGVIRTPNNQCDNMVTEEADAAAEIRIIVYIWSVVKNFYIESVFKWFRIKIIEEDVRNVLQIG